MVRVNYSGDSQSTHLGREVLAVLSAGCSEVRFSFVDGGGMLDVGGCKGPGCLCVVLFDGVEDLVVLLLQFNGVLGCSPNSGAWSTSGPQQFDVLKDQRGRQLIYGEMEFPVHL